MVWCSKAFYNLVISDGSYKRYYVVQLTILWLAKKCIGDAKLEFLLARLNEIL